MLGQLQVQRAGGAGEHVGGPRDYHGASNEDGEREQSVEANVFSARGV